MIKKHSIQIADHTTSVSLEDIFWQELKQIAKSQKKTLSQLVTEIDEHNADRASYNLSSAIRIYVFNHLKKSK